MTENKKITKTVTEITPATSVVEDSIVNGYVVQDLRNSILLVSVIVNLVILTTWITLQVTSMYDAQVVGLLFNR